MKILVFANNSLSLGAILLLGATGCKTIVRENVISTIDTGIGVTLAENPKTELYEAKIGYIRSQFYSVPTGKNVETTGDQTHLSNTADMTPEIVSGIRMESDARHLLLGVSISESFAVGKVAVMSPAAVAMYVSDAKSASTATAAATATAAVADSKEFTTFKDNYALQKKAYDEIKQAFRSGNAAKRTAIRNEASNRNIVPASIPDTQFIQQLNAYVDGSAEHTEPLLGLSKESK